MQELFFVSDGLKSYFIKNHYFQASDNHAFGLQYSWRMGSDHGNMGFAAKKSLDNGSTFHIKSDVGGQIDLAHVSVSVIK